MIATAFSHNQAETLARSKSHLAAPVKSGLLTLDLAREVVRIEAAAIANLASRIDEAHFARAVDLLLGCTGRVVVCGMGKSGHIAQAGRHLRLHWHCGFFRPPRRGQSW